MTAFRVAALSSLGLLLCAAAAVSVGLASLDAVFGIAANPALIAVICGVLVGLPIGAFTFAMFFRRWRRVSWVLLVLAGTGCTVSVALGWSNQWPIRPVAEASTVHFANTSARPVDVVAGVAHACALMDDGTVWCWGSNAVEQLGMAGSWEDPGPDVSSRPRQVADLAGATEIVATDYITCAIAGGRVVCWGGQPSRPDTACSMSGPILDGSCHGWTSDLPAAGFPYQRTPGALTSVMTSTCEMTHMPDALCELRPALTGATSLTLAGDHGCVVAQGRVFCFGADELSQLGDGAELRDADGYPHQGGPVTGVTGAVAVAAGNGASCALVRTGSASPSRVLCWGGAARSVDLATAGAGTPVEITSSSLLLSMPVPAWRLCHVAEPVPAVCVGMPAVSPDALGYSPNPVPTGLPAPITDLDVPGQAGAACAAAANELWCWGWDMGGGGDLTGALSFPWVAHRNDALHGVTRVGVGVDFTCAIAEAEVRCFGLGSSGQLGLPYALSAVDALLPIALCLMVLVMGAAGFAAVRMLQADTRRAAVLASVSEGTLRVGTASTLRIVLAVTVQFAVYALLVWQEGARASADFPLALAVACIAGSVVGLALAVPDPGWRRRALASTAVIATMGAALVWWLPTLLGLIAGTTAQPVASSRLLSSTLAVLYGLAGIAVLLVPPVDPGFSRDFRDAYRTAPGVRAQLSLLSHPWRVFAARAAETERKRLAAELHAEVLPGLYRSLRSVEEGGSVERLALDLRGAVEEVEGMLARRRSIVLEELGLLGALEWLAERTEDRSTATVTIDVEDGAPDGETRVRPPRNVERAAFRVAQLALENVERHAAGATVEITVAVAANRVAMRIADDGPGLTRSAGEAARDGRRGLADMEQATRDCGARLTIGPAHPSDGGRPGLAILFDWS